MSRAFPLAYSGMRIGLYGGSFDPAHEGHAHVAETALNRLGLDRVWWMVTPQNPLKAESAPIEQRALSARRFATPRMDVTTFEAANGYHYTYQTVAALKRRFPGVRFVLVIGADSLANFRYWRRWRAVMESVPLAIVSRPGSGLKARLSKPAQVYARARLPANSARTLPSTRAPAWLYLNARFHTQSSTAMRAVARRAPK